MPDRYAATPDATTRRVPDLVWIAWLVAAGILVVLTVNVVRHLAAGGATSIRPPPCSAQASRAPCAARQRLITEWQVSPLPWQY